eukprot:TRINITY_DN2371_c0_g1_i1.p1 TRINITY_DN2371_c0_g1~~TRINITY_DN2371_c0_g1_i1.p1  ORF type:complete len:532 (+),score=104.88 TRINITY_DN2371_c0_g1_i1:67-1662(+)
MSLLVVCVAASLLSSSPSVTVPGLATFNGINQLTDDVVVESFLGIRFGESERFMPAEMFKPNTTIVNATSYGDTCPGCGCTDVVESEDCLHLNIFRSPENNNNSSKPVMVWIYGGGYVWGCSNSYPGQRIVSGSQQDVIIVTINYRLNAFGFLGTNAGFQDQQLSLQWVNQYISYFGGDPQKVTIFGESAGAGSVSCHLASRLSVTLFSTAIAESGLGSAWNTHSLNDSNKQLNEMFSLTNCSSIKCLQQLPVSTILKLGSQIHSPPGSLVKFAPIVDGVVLEKPPYEMFETPDEYFQKMWSKINVIGGTNRDELVFSYFHMDANLTEEQFDEKCPQDSSLSSQNCSELKQLYDPSNYSYPIDMGGKSLWWWMFIRFKTDEHFTCPHVRSSRSLSPSARVTFSYLFSHPTQTKTWLVSTGKGSVYVPHMSEILYVFNCSAFTGQGDPVTPSSNCNFTQGTGEQELAGEVIQQWVSIASDGRPTNPKWTTYNTTLNDVFSIDVPPAYNGTGMGMLTDFRTQPCLFWDKLTKY